VGHGGERQHRLGTADNSNIVWGTAGASENIVWGTADNIVWGTADNSNIVWGTLVEDNIVWATARSAPRIGGSDDREDTVLTAHPSVHLQQVDQQLRTDDWRFRLPVLSAGDVTLREVRATDAEALVSLLTTPEITRFISTPPQTVEGFEMFIAASQRLRAAGQGACFAVTLRGYDTANRNLPGSPGQLVRRRSPAGGRTIETAEWGFAIGSPFWGTGIFEQCAALVMEFAFEHVRVHRLEARCAVRKRARWQGPPEGRRRPGRDLRRPFSAGTSISINCFTRSSSTTGAHAAIGRGRRI
jgi:ribosomal-protein-alanine N-acetyltransferase